MEELKNRAKGDWQGEREGLASQRAGQNNMLKINNKQAAAVRGRKSRGKKAMVFMGRKKRIGKGKVHLNGAPKKDRSHLTEGRTLRTRCFVVREHSPSESGT